MRSTRNLLTLLAAMAGCGGGESNSVTGDLGFNVQSAVLGVSYYTSGKPGAAIVFLSSLPHDQTCTVVTSNTPPATASFVSFDITGSPVAPGSYTIQPDGGVITFQRYDAYPDGGVLNYAVTATGNATLTSVTFVDQAHYPTTGDSVQGTFSATLSLSDGGTSPLSGSFNATGCP